MTGTPTPPPSAPSSSHLELAPDQALFSGRIQALIAACPENERPLAGLAGVLDWRFEGGISACLKRGAITGKPGECVYYPAERAGALYHVLLVGAGPVSASGKRGPLPASSLRALRRNIESLNLGKVAASMQDLGGQVPRELSTLIWTVR